MLNIPIKYSYSLGAGSNGVVRRAVSYTPASAMTLRQFSFVAWKDRYPNNINEAEAQVTTEVDTLEWEIRTSVSGPRPGHLSSSLLDSGSFDFRYTSQWKIGRPIKFTVNLTSGLELEADTMYWVILKLPDDTTTATYMLRWATTYETGAEGEVDAAVYCSTYTNGTWAAGDNSFNLSLYVLDPQAGSNWHTVINGKGYMQPDKMRGYRAEQVSSGLAQSRGGQSEYSQLRYPYSNLSQSNWTSGSGQLIMEDLAAFLYAKGLDTTIPQQMTIGPKSRVTALDWAAPYNAPTASFPRDLPYFTINGINRYMAQKFTAPAGGLSVASVGIFGRRTDNLTASPPTIAFYTDNAGNPGTLIGSSAEIPTAESGTMLHWIDVVLPTTLTAGVSYWIVVESSQITGNNSRFYVSWDYTGTYAGGAGKMSTNGSSWTTMAGSSMLFRMNLSNEGYVMNGVVKGIKYGLIGSTGTLVAIAGKGVYTWSETNGYWTSIADGIEGDSTTILTADATDLTFFDGKLFVAQGLSNPIRVWDGQHWGIGGTPTLVTNGDFTTDTTGWTAVNATLTVQASGQSGNALKIQNSMGGAYGVAKQAVTVEVGKWYQINVFQKNGDVGGVGKAGTTEEGGEYWNGTLSNATWGWHAKVFKATTATVYVTLYSYGSTINNYTYFDTVQVKELPAASVFHVGKGFIWAATAKNKVRRTNMVAAWSAEITVGEDLFAITAFANYMGYLLVGKEDGIWSIDDQDLATEYLIFREHADANNCVGMTVWSGMLFIPVQNTVWRWQGSQYKEVGPTDKRSGPSKEWPNKISRMTSTAPLLFASASPVVSTGYGGVVAYNGLGWHHLMSASIANLQSHAIAITSEIGTDELRVWWGQGRRVAYAKFPTFTNNRYDWVNADYTLEGGVFVSSWWDGGLKDALKFWNRLTFMADIPNGTYIEVLCAMNGEDWTSTEDLLLLGTLTSDQIEDTGEFVLMFPDGMVAKSIQLVFILNTTRESLSPRIRAFNIESVVRQPPVYAYTFRILLADNVTKMSSDSETTRTANDMWEELQRAASSNAPIIVSFPQKTIRGLISYLSEETVAFKPDGMDEEKWERVANISIVEAT